MRYKETVARIVALPWDELNGSALLEVMILSLHAAKEFSESLRVALGIYPDHLGLQMMARGELNTNNLEYLEYQRMGDHWEFLSYFLIRHQILEPTRILTSGVGYRNAIQKMLPTVRAMSIFSREKELEAIFESILKADESYWESHDALLAFRYYLRRHIEVDSEAGGHADMIADMPIDDRVNEFYEARLRLYEPIFPGLCMI